MQRWIVGTAMAGQRRQQVTDSFTRRVGRVLEALSRF